MLNRKIFTVFCLLSCLLAVSENGHARTINVQCGATTRGPNTITAALKLLVPGGPNTLNIFGTCTENVVISGFNRLSLVGKHGGTVIDASGGAAQTILVIDSTDVIFRQLFIDGGLIGVQCDDFSVCRFDGDTVVNGRDGGIQITQSRVTALLETTETALVHLTWRASRNSPQHGELLPISGAEQPTALRTNASRDRRMLTSARAVRNSNTARAWRRGASLGAALGYGEGRRDGHCIDSPGTA
jgi:hypothetical protein